MGVNPMSIFIPLRGHSKAIVILNGMERSEESYRSGESEGSPSREVKGAMPMKGREPPRCDLCGAPMEDVQCKLRCRKCGYTRDCSDP